MDKLDENQVYQIVSCANNGSSFMKIDMVEEACGLWLG